LTELEEGLLEFGDLVVRIDLDAFLKVLEALVEAGLHGKHLGAVTYLLQQIITID